jgi:molybdate transport system substrate-binding protein
MQGVKRVLIWMLPGLTLVGMIGHANQQQTITVFAAASLTDAFTELGQAFEKRNGARVVFQFAGSQTLKTQLENGARADAFASADSTQFDPLVRAGWLEPGVVFARNRLVVITPKRGVGRVKTLLDLGASGVRLVIAQENVPVGRYTLQVLENLSKTAPYGMDFSARVLRNVVSEETNVRQVALKVHLGEADAGIVYATDVTPPLAPSVLQIAIPARANVIAAYPIGLVRNASNPSGARALIAFVRSSEGQTVLRRWGFLGPNNRNTP